MQSSSVNSSDNSAINKLNDAQNFIPESSKKWNSSVSFEERQIYESYLELKNSFQASLEYLPKTFHPEKDDYQQKVSLILIGFMVLAGFVLFLDLIFLIMRFCCKKCVGPIKSSQVTRGYRNFTWILMGNAVIKFTLLIFSWLTYFFDYCIHIFIDIFYKDKVRNKIFLFVFIKHNYDKFYFFPKLKFPF